MYIYASNPLFVHIKIYFRFDMTRALCFLFFYFFFSFLIAIDWHLFLFLFSLLTILEIEIWLSKITCVESSVFSINWMNLFYYFSPCCCYCSYYSYGLSSFSIELTKIISFRADKTNIGPNARPNQSSNPNTLYCTHFAVETKRPIKKLTKRNNLKYFTNQNINTEEISICWLDQTPSIELIINLYGMKWKPK